MSFKIIVIDDEKPIRDTLKGVLEDEGYVVLTSPDGNEGLRLTREQIPDCVLLDIWMPGLDGIAVLEKLKEELPQIPVIIMSGHGTIETAVKATKMGAFDFIEKPISLEKLILLVNNAISYYKILNENIFLRKRLEKDLVLVSHSLKMQKVMSHIESLSKSDMSIMLLGEDGTGKSFLARLIHNQSDRKKNSFIEFDAMLPESDAEFKEAIGLAYGGTLFIKNFNYLNQLKQLMLIENKNNIRYVLATSADLEYFVTKDNAFKNFVYNINATRIVVPPLRERKDDIKYFINYYVKYFSKIYNKNIRFSDEAINVLEKYSWEGNIKELKNFVEHIFITFQTEVVTHNDLPDYIMRNCKVSIITEKLFQHNLLSEAQKYFEKEFIKSKLIESCGNIKKTSEILGLEQSELLQKVTEHNLKEYVR